MAVTPPPGLTPAPSPAPQRGDRTTFKDRVDAFITWLTSAVGEFAAVATNVYNNATDAYNNALSAATKAGEAAASAAEASATANVTKWVSGTVYAQGACVWSPADFGTYRRKVGGSGAADPSADAANWEKLTTASAPTTPPGMVLLATLTPTAAAAVNALNVFSSTYDSYLIIGQGLCPAATDALVARLAVAGTIDTAANYATVQPTGATVYGAYTSVMNNISLSVSGTGRGLNFSAIVANANDATNLKSVVWDATLEYSATQTTYTKAGSAYKGGVVTGISFYWGAASNFKAQGSIRIYGIRKA